MSVEIHVGDIEKQISDQIEKAVSASVDQKLANDTAEIIKRRTELGFGVNDNGKQVKLKPLSDSYKAQRRGDIAFYTDANGNKRVFRPDRPPKLSSRTTPAKSNVTKTGQMLSSIKGTIKNSSIFINVSGRRNDGSGLSNEEVKDFVEAQGRRFLFLTSAEKKQLTRKLKDRILSNL